MSRTYRKPKTKGHCRKTCSYCRPDGVDFRERRLASYQEFQDFKKNPHLVLDKTA